jgi:DNA-binding transcriptional LysR family regulator
VSLRFHQLDLNLLVALDVLLAERSITGSALRLNLSQSATSGILGRLREYFGDELLVQVGRKMMPTPLAVSLGDRVRNVLLTVHSTIVNRSDFTPATSNRHFRICASDFVKTVLLTEVVRRLEREAPGVTLEFSGPDGDPLGQLDRGELDFLILPEYLLEKQHPKISLFESRHTCVVWTGNHLVKESLTFEQYMGLGHVVVRIGATPQPSFEEWFIKQFGHTRRIEIITDSFNSMPQFIFGTLRVATVHERLAEFYAKYMQLRLIPPPLDIPVLTEGLQWHKYLDSDPGHRWMKELIRNAAANVGQAGTLN